MGIILMIEKTIFKYCDAYIDSIVPLLNCKIKLYNISEFNNRYINQNNKYIFWLRLPNNLKITDKTNNIYLFNTEQMSKKMIIGLKKLIKHQSK